MEQSCLATSEFGTLLRHHRLAAGVSQEVLAEQARMSANGISALERGERRSPYRETVALLVKALSLPPAVAAEFEAAAARPQRPRARPDRGNEGALATNLPSQRTSLVGRETEIANIIDILEDSRLVTVTGAGGIGKTRIALAVGEALVEDTKAGVRLVELAPLAQGALVTAAVARALNVTDSPNRPLLEVLIADLKHKELLLILDNCEHLIGEAAAVADALLRACPQLRILATSREPLRIAGERSYRLPSLPFPTPQEGFGFSAADAIRYAAVVLFAQRAQAGDRRFTLTDGNAPSIAEVCRRLDGIPLAIELAAARVKILSPRQLSERLDERFRVLTAGSRDVLPRHETLRALIDWSNDLLSEPERMLFRRLGVFVSGFTLEGATAVGSGVGLNEFDVFDLLASLIDKSLVLADPAGNALRYRLLESTRVYAREKLQAANEWEATAGRHLRYLRDMFTVASERSDQSGREDAMREAEREAELDDVRAALDWALAGSDARSGGELLVAIVDRWINLGRLGEARMRLEAFAAALADDCPAVLSRLLSALGRLARISDRLSTALALTTEALALARASGDSGILASALAGYAWSAILVQLFDRAEAALAESEAIAARSTNVRLCLLTTRAAMSHLRGDLDAAARAWQQIVDEARSVGDRFHEFTSLGQLAECEHERGKTQRAIAITHAVLPVMRSDGYRGGLISYNLTNLAGYLVALDDLQGASAAARDAICELRQDPNSLVAQSAEHLALALALSGDLQRAGRLAGYADATFRSLGVGREYTEKRTNDRLGTVLRDSLAQKDLMMLLAEGATLSTEAAIALALVEPEGAPG